MKLDTIKKTLPLLLLMTIGNMACSDNDPIEEIGTETLPELSIEAEVHNTMLCNFYQREIKEETHSDNLPEGDTQIYYVPSTGIALDESRPSIRSAEAETYDAARNDFMSHIPNEEDAQTLITVSDTEVSVNLGNYGNVKFSASNEDGSLAKVEINLTDAHPYTLHYKPHSAFPDNDDNNQNLSKIYPPGTIIQDKQTLDYYIVTESSCFSLDVLGDCHKGWYAAFDYWKTTFHFFNAAPTKEQWIRIRNSWKNNKGLFVAAFKKFPTCTVSFLYEIMEGSNKHKNVCVEGNDIGKHRVNFWAHPTWYSQAKLIKVDDLRKDKFDLTQTSYAADYSPRYLDTYYLTYKYITRSNVKNYKIVYPIN